MDGWVTIGIKGDSSQLERDIKNSEKLLRQYEKEAEQLGKAKLKSESDVSEYEAGLQALEQMKQEELKVALSEEQRNDIIKEYNMQQEVVNAALELERNNLQQINTQIEQNKLNQGLMNTKIEEMNDKLNKAKRFIGIKNSIDNVGKSVDKVTKKVRNWALALIGIRSAYGLIRQAMSTLSQYDEGMAQRIEYMQFLLANALKPIIERLIDLAYRLLGYINAISQAWFGVNLFANASTKAFQKQNKALTGNVKKAKELEKTLTGFDEMNIVQDTGSVTGGGGGGGAQMPELPSIEQIETPPWLDFIIKHKDEIISTLAGIGTALGLIKLGISPLVALGIGAIVGGIVYSVKSLLKYLKNPTWKNFGKIIEGIGIAIIGLGIAFLGLPAVITGVVVLIFGIITSYWDKIKKKLDDGVKWLESKTDWVRKKFGIFGETIYKIFIDLIKNVIDWWDTLFTSVKGIFDGIIKFVKGVFTGNWKEAWEGLKNIFGNMLNIMFNTTKLVFGSILDVAKNIGKSILEVFKGIWDGITSIFSKLGDFFYNTFKKAWEGIKKLFSKGGQIFDGLKDGIVDTFKTIVNTLIKGINKVIAIPFDKINWLLNKIRNVSILGVEPFKGLWKQDPVPVPQIPKLAKGGIINMAGRGVPLPMARGGEAGKEGVIPLTDSQQMALLGEAIGKYITINATITNTMNGRVISRELQKVNNENNFAYNR